MSRLLPSALLIAAAAGLAVAGPQGPPPAAPPAPPVLAQVPPVTTYRDYAPAQGEGGFGFGGPAVLRPLGDDPRTRDLARKLADAKDDEARDKLRGELKAAQAKAFDERQKGQEKQVEEAEKQLKRLKDTIVKRREAKAEILADRLAALEKEARGLGW